jgi:hypothetical protein
VGPCTPLARAPFRFRGTHSRHKCTAPSRPPAATLVAQGAATCFSVAGPGAFLRVFGVITRSAARRGPQWAPVQRPLGCRRGICFCLFGWVFALNVAPACPEGRRACPEKRETNRRACPDLSRVSRELRRGPLARHPRFGPVFARPFAAHRCARPPDRHSERAVGRDRTRSVTQVKIVAPARPSGARGISPRLCSSLFRVGSCRRPSRRRFGLNVAPGPSARHSGFGPVWHGHSPCIGVPVPQTVIPNALSGAPFAPERSYGARGIPPRLGSLLFGCPTLLSRLREGSVARVGPCTPLARARRSVATPYLAAAAGRRSHAQPTCADPFGKPGTSSRSRVN